MTTYTVPGASTRGFTIAPTDTDVPAALAALRADATARKNEIAAKALAALDGTDPVLYKFAVGVRPAVAKIWRSFDEQIAAVRAGPEHLRLLQLAAIASDGRDARRLSEAAAELEAPVLAARDAALDAAAAGLQQQLGAIAASLRAKHAALAGGAVTDAEMASAHAVADRLHRLDPAYGLVELTDFLNQVGTGERSRGELVALLPILKSAHDHEGSAWTQNGDLLELIRIGADLSDGGWPAAVVSARLQRAAKLEQDLFLFLRTAKDGGQLPSDVDEETGRLRLFPTDLPAPIGAPPEEKSAAPTADTTFRRVAVSAEQRALDAAAKAAQAETDAD